MGTHMKTTVDIADTLFERAKAAAARQNRTLRDLIETGLRLVLEQEDEAPFVLPDARVDGNGLTSEFRDAGWERTRAAIYDEPDGAA